MHSKPTVAAGPGRYVITGTVVVLSGKAEGEGLVYSLSPDNYINDITTPTPIVTPIRDIVYTLTASSLYGCTNKDDVLVKVVMRLYIPTAFTPNGDGKNDERKVPFLYPAYDVSVGIFNRFGQLVYQASGEVISWDGKFRGCNSI